MRDGPVTFQRLYRDAAGPIYPATPEIVTTVIRSMNEHATGEDPFRVRFEMHDGSRVTLRAKRSSAGGAASLPQSSAAEVHKP